MYENDAQMIFLFQGWLYSQGTESFIFPGCNLEPGWGVFGSWTHPENEGTTTFVPWKLGPFEELLVERVIKNRPFSNGAKKIDVVLLFIFEKNGHTHYDSIILEQKFWETPTPSRALRASVPALREDMTEKKQKKLFWK